MTGRLAGQTINDRLLAAKHSLAGQGLAKSVCKATTEEMIGPKKKHLDYLVHCTNEPNVSIPQLANLLIERSQNTNWVVVYKALVTVHHMMCYGNEIFYQNVRGLRTKTIDLYKFISEGVYTVIPLTETWLGQNITNAELANSNYSIYRCDRNFEALKVSRGGGVLLAIKSSINCATLDLSSVQEACPNIDIRFTQYLASSNSTFQLSNFLDKSGVQGYDMSPFIRRYSRYLNEKALSYRTVAFDFCKVKRGKDDGKLRTMNADSLLKTLPVLQNQLDALLEFDCSSSDLTNGVINMSFMLLFRDLIRLFACYNDGIINLLEKYFDMNKKQCKEALDIYKKFLIRMDRVAEFLKVAENVGIDKGDIPDLTKAPSSLLDALEQHFNHMEGKKSSSTTPSSHSSSNNQKNVKSGVTALSSTSNAFGNVVANGKFDSSNGIDENLKLQILAEEEAAMNQFKQKVSPSSSNNPFLSNSSSSATISSPQTAIINNVPAVDLFASDPVSTPLKASDDLLQLSNPFADPFMAPTPTSVPLNQPQLFLPPQQNNIWMTNGNAFGAVSPTTNPVITNGTFVTENNFASVFGSTENKGSGFEALGGVLQPVNANGQINNEPTTNSSNDNSLNNNINNSSQQTTTSPNGLLTGDLESSLASLAENLTIHNRTASLKGVQWNSPKGGSKQNNTWTPQPISDTTGAGYKPMNQSMNTSPFSSMTITSPQPQIYPQMLGMRPMPTAMMSTMPAMTPMNPPQNTMGQSLLFH